MNATGGGVWGTDGDGSGEWVAHPVSISAIVPPTRVARTLEACTVSSVPTPAGELPVTAQLRPRVALRAVRSRIPPLTAQLYPLRRAGDLEQCLSERVRVLVVVEP